MTFEELKRIADSVGEREGWDFSRVRDEIDPVPWDYLKVARRYLRPADRVLDVGTGGGEKLLSLVACFDSAIGIDISPEMIETAQKNKAAARVDNVSFEVMRAEDLRFPDSEFDVLLNRHSVADADEIVRVLRPGGYFVMQEVGQRNLGNICSLFGCDPGGEYGQESQGIGVLVKAFRERGCRLICTAEYDVGYWFLDVESLIFLLKAIPIPQDFDIERHWRQVNHIIAEFSTPKGIESNEHRELLIVQKMQCASDK